MLLSNIICIYRLKILNKKPGFVLRFCVFLITIYYAGQLLLILALKYAKQITFQQQNSCSQSLVISTVLPYLHTPPPEFRWFFLTGTFVWEENKSCQFLFRFCQKHAYTVGYWQIQKKNNTREIDNAFGVQL